MIAFISYVCNISHYIVYPVAQDTLERLSDSNVHNIVSLEYKNHNFSISLDHWASCLYVDSRIELNRLFIKEHIKFEVRLLKYKQVNIYGTEIDKKTTWIKDEEMFFDPLGPVVISCQKPYTLNNDKQSTCVIVKTTIGSAKEIDIDDQTAVDALVNFEEAFHIKEGNIKTTAFGFISDFIIIEKGDTTEKRFSIFSQLFYFTRDKYDSTLDIQLVSKP
ncbi:hypothetical protein CDIK_3574 [Cucumispora dikerogammari]|nr:hypothetical protein CDIK_3574 [Cucumispora dikerogammari]